MPESPENEKDGADVTSRIEATVERISEKVEKMRTLDYVFFVDHPYKRIWHNFVNGVARGVGSAIGFSVVFALIIMILEWIGNINLPIISELVNFILGLTEK
ncbi:MAG: hypothetical protein E7384_08680 [Ruminococcaceae bacterium]|nr:hypothetical protein [Oscillospiraceae bacterium]